MSDEPRYEPIDDDLPPPDLPDQGDVPPTGAKPFKPPVNLSKGMPKRPSARGSVSESKSVPADPALANSNTPLKDEKGGEVRVRLLLTLPEALVQYINSVRAQAGMAAEAVTTLPLTAAFTASDESALRESLAEFEQEYLPLSLTLKQVQAEVRDQQTYIAAWQVDAEQALGKLRAALIDKMKPEPDAVLPFEPMIVVSNVVSAKQFPALIAAMQRDFQPLQWQIDAITVETAS